jgi:hypothetical protein
MFRFPYRNFGSHESMVGAFTVGGGLGQAGAAVRWFELRNTGGGWNLYQEGTQDTGDGNDRFMPSIAMDGNGNIALGYSVSSSAIHPAIRYATRLASDPLGTLQTEASLIEGGGSQTGSNRWGDYSAMGIDPANDCTFWYTNEYYPVNSANQWKTRIGVFSLPECTGAPTPTPSPTPEPGAGIHVGDLDGSSSPAPHNRWNATVTITIHDQDENLIPNAFVSGLWSSGTSGSGSCTTNASGQCDVSATNLLASTGSVVFSVSSVSLSGNAYDPAANHDPDGDSDGTSITVSQFGPPTATPTPTATPIPGASIHVGDLDGSSLPGTSGRWTAVVTVTIHDQDENPVANAFVSGLWSSGASGSGSCTTNASGQCQVSSLVRTTSGSVVFSVSGVSLSGNAYDPAANHDPDGDSDGTSITVPQS